MQLNVRPIKMKFNKIKPYRTFHSKEQRACENRAHSISFVQTVNTHKTSCFIKNSYHFKLILNLKITRKNEN